MYDPEELYKCEACWERRYATRPVMGIGPLTSRICFLGRNPGKTEDQSGEPFRGPAGQKLDRGLVTAGLLRRTVRIENIARCVTPSKVTPSRKCRAVCAEKWLQPVFEAMDKLELVVTLGNEALQYFEPEATVGMLHGTHFMTTIPGTDRHVEVFVMYHPSAALRSAERNRHYKADAKKLYPFLLERGLIKES